MPLETGSRLGPHEILGLLGAGGMGEVYRAHDTKLNRQVAIKILPDTAAGDPDRVARFQREAQAVAALNHPNIAAIYELAESGETKFLVLELVDGETLAEKIEGQRAKRTGLEITEALTIAKQILDALEAAHEKGICHRDLKPANVKLTTTGSVKVLDFGLAKFLQAAPAVGNLTHSPTLTVAGTFPGVILGTAGYMSPEQAKGYEADQRSDIFSFGCILYELLTGRQAFDGETASEILASVLKIEVDFSALPPRLHPRLKEVLQRCLEKNPKKRWHAAADVRVELESLMDRALVVEEPRTTVSAAAPRPLWKRAIPIAATAIASTAIAGYAVWRLKPEPTRPVMRFTVPLPEGQQFTNPGRQVLAISPDGANLVFGANRRLWIRSLSTLDARVIAGSENDAGILNPAFSPDGQSLVFFSGADRTLKRLAVSGGAAVTICPADGPFGLHWNEDGIVFGQSGKGILRVSPEGGVPEVIATADAGEIASMPEMLPGGKAVLFSVKKETAGWDKAQVVVQPLGGAKKVLVNGGSDGRYLPTGHLAYAIGGTLFAVAFDLAALRVTGGPVPIVEGVRRAASGPNSTGTAQFAFSTNGTLAYVRGPAGNATPGNDLAVFDRRGSLQPLKLPPAAYRSPRISPDGKFVAFDSEDDKDAIVWVYELSGASNIRRLTFGGKNRAPIWSADSQWVAFQSDREGDLAIFRQRADGSGTAQRMTKPEKGAAHTPETWAPDGAHVLFNVQAENKHALWMLTVKDGQTAAFGEVQSDFHVEAVFSPDGRWVAYQTRQAAGNNSTYLQPFPSTGAKYQVPLTGGAPYWTSKGELVLNTGPTRSEAIAVVTTPSVSFGRPFDISRAARIEGPPTAVRRNVDAMPDGEHIIGVLGAEASAQIEMTPQITVVLNWFDDVRRRVPVK